jgi:hypothetical protein
VKVQKKPVLNGIEIMQELNIQPSDPRRLPEIGKAQKFLLDVADEYAEQGREMTKADAVEELHQRFRV